MSHHYFPLKIYRDLIGCHPLFVFNNVQFAYLCNAKIKISYSPKNIYNKEYVTFMFLKSSEENLDRSLVWPKKL